MLDSAGEKWHGYGMRIGVKKKGCSGLTYQMKIDKIQEKDEVLDFRGKLVNLDFKILVDAKDSFYLFGTKIDFIFDEISSKFVFGNPNATNVCGCGESFEITQKP